MDSLYFQRELDKYAVVRGRDWYRQWDQQPAQTSSPSLLSSAVSSDQTTSKTSYSDDGNGSIWGAMESYLTGAYSAEMAGKIVSQLKANYSYLLYSLSLDDIEQIAQRFNR